MPATARAGTYDVRACGASSAQAFTLSNEGPLTINSGIQCPPSGSQLLSGVFAGVSSSGFTLARAGASWTIAAPTGLQLDRLDVKRSLGRISAAWQVDASTPATVLEACDQNDPTVCRLGSAGGEQVAYADLHAPSVTFRLECHPPAPDDDLACVGRSNTQAWVAIYGATARVEDPAPPSVEPLNISPGWHSGSEPLTIAASDASGVKSVSATAGATNLFDKQQACDYSRMQPCPAGVRESIVVDTSRLEDGTWELKAVVTDAADQAGAATTVLKVDRHAPAMPENLAVERNPDGTMAFVWTNPAQGTAAPVDSAHFEVCDAAGAVCSREGVVSGPGIARVNAVAIPDGPHLVRVWLEDEAGNADRGNAATLAVDPATISARRAVELNPPVFTGGAAPGFRVTSARRHGSTLTLSGTIAKAATSRITAKVSHGTASASARTNPKRGRWSLKLKLTPTLRRATTLSVTLTYTGQAAFRGSTVWRRLTKQPRTETLRVSQAAARRATPTSSSAGTGRPK